jgi:hypothetical protein
LVFLCCPARNYPKREGGPNPSTDPPQISRKKLFPTSTLPENRKGRKRRTTNNEEEGEEEEALEALETTNKKPEERAIEIERDREIERQTEGEILSLSLKPSISTYIGVFLYVCATRVMLSLPLKPSISSKEFFVCRQQDQEDEEEERF